MASVSGGVLALVPMTRNTVLRDAMPLPDALAGRSIVVVGLMGAGKTSIGRRLAAGSGTAVTAEGYMPGERVHHRR